MVATSRYRAADADRMGTALALTVPSFPPHQSVRKTTIVMRPARMHPRRRYPRRRYFPLRARSPSTQIYSKGTEVMLSPRERDVVRLIACAHSDKQIAF